MTHGGQTENTFEKTAELCTGRLGEKGCWSVKARRNVGVKVGCYLQEATSKPKRFGRENKHYAQCSHGTMRAGGKSRKSCLKVAKLSHTWCKSCTKAHKALTEQEIAE